MGGSRKDEVLAEVIAVSARVHSRPRTFWQRLGQRLDGAVERASGGHAFRRDAEEFGRQLERMDLAVIASLSDEERQLILQRTDAVIGEIERYVSLKGWGRSSQDGLPLITLVYRLRAASERVHGPGRPSA